MGTVPIVGSAFLCVRGYVCARLRHTEKYHTKHIESASSRPCVVVCLWAFSSLCGQCRAVWTSTSGGMCSSRVCWESYPLLCWLRQWGSRGTASRHSTYKQTHPFPGAPVYLTLPYSHIGLMAYLPL